MKSITLFFLKQTCGQKVVGVYVIAYLQVQYLSSCVVHMVGGTATYNYSQDLGPCYGTSVM